MPHLVIEYSGGMEPGPDFKAKAIPYSCYQLNDGSRSFVHHTLSPLDGRTPAPKEALAPACRVALVESCPRADPISVDIRDMDAHAYRKRVRQAGSSS